MKQSYIVSTRTFVRNLFTNWVSLIAEILVAFFLTPFIVAKLGLAIYGVWSLINGLIGYLGIVDMGIRGSTGRFINHYLARNEHRSVNEIVNTSLMFFTLISVVLVGISWVAAKYFAQLFPQTPESVLKDIEIIAVLLSVSLWLTFLMAIYRHILNALDRFEIGNAIQIFVLCSRTAGVIYALLNDKGLIGLVWASLIANVLGIVSLIFASLLIYKPLVFSLNMARYTRFREMWKFGTAVFIVRGANQLVYQSDQVIIMTFFGPAAVGIYSIANMLVQNGQKVVDQISSTLYPSVVKSGSLKDYSGLRGLYLWNAKLSFFIGIILFIGFIVFGANFIDLWVGKEYRDAAIILTVMALSELVALFSSTAGPTLFSLGKVKLNVVLQCAYAALNIIVSLFLVWATDLGVLGVVLGTLIASIVFRSVLYTLFTALQIDLPLLEYVKNTGLRVFVMAILTYMVFNYINHILPISDWQEFIMAVLFAAVIYLVIASVVLLDREQIMFVKKKIWR